MLERQSEADWEWYGKNDPYFGVITWDRFSRDNLTETNKAAFFQHGEDYVQALVERIQATIGLGFHPAHALDFGCGVGRVTIPLARRFAEVVGVDISPSMLQHARDNCTEHGIDNARFIETRDLDGCTEVFDFIHSHIVFQHIPVSTGEALTRKLLTLLSPGGVGVLHYTYSDLRKLKARSRLLMFAYRHVPFVYRLRGLFKQAPVMQMNKYDLNTLLSLIQAAGCTQAHLQFTEHGTQGVVIIFQKESPDS